MSLVDTADINLQRALNRHLSAMTPVIGISWENTNFIAANGIGYLETWLLPIPTKAITLGPEYWEEFSGIFQVTCVYPSGRGTNDAKTKATAVKSHFKRGTVCTYNSLVVKVKEAYPASGYYSEDGSWYRIPVSVVYTVYASN